MFRKERNREPALNRTDQTYDWRVKGLSELGHGKTLWRRSIMALAYGTIPLTALSSEVVSTAQSAATIIGNTISTLLPGAPLDLVGDVMTSLEISETGIFVLSAYLIFGVVPLLASLGVLFQQSQIAGEHFNRNVPRNNREVHEEIDKARDLKNARAAWRNWRFIMVLFSLQHAAVFALIGMFMPALIAVSIGAFSLFWVVTSYSYSLTALAKKFLSQLCEERDRNMPNADKMADMPVMQVLNELAEWIKGQADKSRRK